MKKLILLTFIFFTAFILSGCKKTNDVQNKQAVKNDSSEFTFETPKKSAHYETNTPKHGSVLAGDPINVVIDFNFDLSEKSTIKVENNGKDYGMGNTIIDKNKLSMRRIIESTAPNGLYTVTYNACWPDNTCHDGKFQFAIDKSKASTFEDMTAKNEVTIALMELKFTPQNLRIKKGTKVVWINNENIEHYINTDSHPAHTYFEKQNSKALKKGESYSVIFEEAGIFPYHCSAHADIMTGNILVD